MLRSLFIFFISGIIWLFLFSIPVGHQGKRLFHLGYYYLVDTRPVHFVTNLISKTAHQTEDKANETFDDVVQKMEKNSNQ